MATMAPTVGHQPRAPEADATGTNAIPLVHVVAQPATAPQSAAVQLSPYTDYIAPSTGTLTDAATTNRLTEGTAPTNRLTEGTATTRLGDTHEVPSSKTATTTVLPASKPAAPAEAPPLAVLPPPPTNDTYDTTNIQDQQLKGKKGQPKMIDSRRVAHQRNKMILWIIWMALMVANVVWLVLAFICFGRLQYIQNHTGGFIGTHELWGVLTATMITPIMVIIYFVFGTLLLAIKSKTESGFTYGFGLLHASTFWLALLMLQATVTMHSYNSRSRHQWRSIPVFKWSSSNASLYTATYVIGYILVCLYIALFVVFIALKGSLQELYLENETPATSQIGGPPNNKAGGKTGGLFGHKKAKGPNGDTMV